MTAHRAVSAIMSFITRVLGYRLGRITQFPRAFKNGTVTVVVLNLFRVHAHAITDSIHRLLVLQGGEKRQTRIGPFLPDKALGLKRGGPVDRTTTTPGGSSEDGHAAVITHGGAAAFEQVHISFIEAHGEIVCRVVVGLFDHQDPMASFSEVLGRNAATTTAAYNHDVGLDRFWLVTWRELQELVWKAFCRFTVDWNAGEPNHGAESGTDGRPGLLEDGTETPVDCANGAQAGGFPTAKYPLTDLQRLVHDEGCRAGEDERARSRAAQGQLVFTRCRESSVYLSAFRISDIPFFPSSCIKSAKSR